MHAYKSQQPAPHLGPAQICWRIGIWEPEPGLITNREHKLEIYGEELDTPNACMHAICYYEKGEGLQKCEKKCDNHCQYH